MMKLHGQVFTFRREVGNLKHVAQKLGFVGHFKSILPLKNLLRNPERIALHPSHHVLPLRG